MTSRALELHDVFDRGFAAAPPPPEPAHTDYLCIRVAGEPAALVLTEIASLHADLRIVALPTPARELLGVASIRSAIVPIYDLASAFGTARGPQAVRWSVLVRGERAGFAFEGFDGHARIADRAIAAATQRGRGRGQFVLAGQARSIIDIDAVLTSIENRWRPSGAAKDS